MLSGRRHVRVHVLFFALILAALAPAAAGADRAADETREAALVQAPRAASRPLETGIMDPRSFVGPDGKVALRRARKAGARYIRVLMDWARTAPRQKSTAFEPRNPGDRGYRWTEIDERVRAVVDMGLTPIVYVQAAPSWTLGCAADPGPCRPQSGDLGDFMTAAARRYSGTYRGLPRVRYWQVWNEPNFNLYLMPQADEAGKPASPQIYRELLNAAYRAIHQVRQDNVVIGGGTMPFGGYDDYTSAVPPLLFMRQLLCLSGESRPRPICRDRVFFDVWSHHPYTQGDPTHHASVTDNVSVPDLWKMRLLLEAAERAGNLHARGRVRFWVTEFAWDSSPPDPQGVPEQLHARWVSEAMYRMWSQGVSLVTWFLLRDQPDTPFQSGLYLRGPAGIGSDRPKLALKAFRFPFVAFREPGTQVVRYWGRSPQGQTAVVVEQRRGSWRSETKVRPNRFGVFLGRFRSPSGDAVRARLADRTGASIAFSLTVPPDRPGCVWGTC